MASPTKEQLDAIKDSLHKEFMDAMLLGTSARMAGKRIALAELYGTDMTDAMHAIAGAETGRVSRMQRSSMHKRDFERLAVACQEIEQGLKRDLGLATPARDKIMEIVVARLALACHDQNNEFDSFKFNAAARKRKP